MLRYQQRPMRTPLLWLLLAACARSTLTSRTMCTYVTLDRSGGRWRIPAHCTHLYLTQVPFGPAGARQMGEALKGNIGVTQVDASSCGIRGLSGAQALGNSLRHNTILTRLDLGNNALGDAGAVAIAEGLAANTGLRSLNLAHNKVGPAGARALAAALRSNTGLSWLNLDSNRLHDEGAVALAEMLVENESLRTLVLSGNQIGNEGAARLATALVANRGLTLLHLKYNRISGEGARLLAEAAVANGRVKLVGPEFLVHSIERHDLKRDALQARNATLMLGIAGMYTGGRLSAHKVVDRYSQAHCWYTLAAQHGDARQGAVARAAQAELTKTDHTHWPLSLLLSPRCPAACVAHAEEVCQAPLAERAGKIITHGGRKKRWLRREVGGPHHAKDEL
jgi:hypothetical protein